MTTLPLKTLLASALLVGVAVAEEKILTDFESTNGLRWQTVNDGVMGGRSRGGPQVTEQGTLVFKGVISLENNGGFSSVRTRPENLAVTGYDGLSLRVKGDGRSYRVSLRIAGAPRMVAFWADLKTKTDEWTTVRVPFSAFVPTAFGRRLPGPSLDVDRINSVGFMLYDKKAGPFALEVDSISAYGGADAAPDAETIVDVARKAGTFETLLAAATAAGLLDTLSSSGPLTVLAPTDEAFAAVPKGVLQGLLKPENREQLRAVLTHHVIPGSVALGDLLAARQAKTANGQRAAVTVAGSTIKIGGATVLTPDLHCSNGTVHVIDRVLIPELATLAAVAEKANTFKTLLAAAKAAGLAPALVSKGPLTVFAPSDAAFAKLPAGSVEGLLEPGQRTALVRILKHHIVSGTVYLDQALAAKQAKTLAGTELTVVYAKGAVEVGSARIVAADVPAANGVLHVIDRVLLPPTAPLAGGLQTTPSREGGSADTARARALIEVAIERGVPLFNAGQVEACAAIYEVAVRSLIVVGDEVFGPATRRALKESLKRPAVRDAAAEHAWILRRALDAAHGELGAQASEGVRDRWL